ncbi:hypothetical protein [Mucilaginibacter aquatilis]|uniref:Uncharacterized protein n=1 Tax=Mucilaginibacter aquatilis TaxID=1517760 RepID=A0A6I4IAR2_9SPHI|nr:hypothetical protein [Mucilaginibacter aquatilis]MVN92265.1 hypothetical protein [Mucilaginibacter aquatilis]
MYRKDYFLNETQRLAQIIARLLGLKDKAESREELQQVYNHTLATEFSITEKELLELSLEDFKAWLTNQNFSAVKLDTLAQVLYLRAEPDGHNEHASLLMQKTITVYDMLEQEHHQQSFENIGKRAAIQNYLKQHGA